MKWYCKKCKGVMESKTALVKTTGRRYRVDCNCTESVQSDREVIKFQSDNWIELGGQSENYSKKTYEAYE